MESLNAYGMAVIPVVIGLIELLKRAGLPKKFSPLVSLIIGVLTGFYYLAPGDPLKAIFLGLVVGLSAVGMYSGAKNTIQQASPYRQRKLFKKRSKKRTL